MRSIFASFAEADSAQEAAAALLDHGLEQQALSLVAHNPTTGLDLGLVCLIIPGFGLVTGRGALARAAMAAAGSIEAASLAGGIAAYLVDHGMPSLIAVDCERALEEVGAVVEVDLFPKGALSLAEVQEILVEHGAEQICAVPLRVPAGTAN